MTDAVIIKTRKFKRNPLLARKQVCRDRRIWIRDSKTVQCMDDDIAQGSTVESNSLLPMDNDVVKNALSGGPIRML